MQCKSLVDYLKGFLLSLLVGYTFIVWIQGISVCYKRILLFHCGFAFFVFHDPRALLNAVVILIVTLILWSVNSQNSLDLQRHPSCYDYQSNIFLLAAYIMYSFLTAVFSVVSFGFTTFLSITLCYDFWGSLRGRSYAAFQNNDIINAVETKYLKENFKLPFNSETMDANSCSICLINFDEGELLIMLPECKHIYHEECLDQWLRINSVCPYCRFNVRDMVRQRIDAQY